MPRLEFWYEFASPYSYLSVMRIAAAAHRAGVALAWKPFLLGPIFRDLGHATSPFVESEAKGAYLQQDLARQCRKHGLAAWRPPSVFPRRSVRPARLALLGAERPWIGAFSRAVMALNFVQDGDIESPAALAAILEGLGLPAAELLAEAEGEAVRAALRQQTARAAARGVFGAPTFFVGDEMFWGDDRLEDALALASSGA